MEYHEEPHKTIAECERSQDQSGTSFSTSFWIQLTDSKKDL